MEKGAIVTSLPIADENQAWDSGAAIKRVKDWASDSDGNIDFKKYSRAFFWVDGDASDKQGDYKLPFADVSDGELKAVWRGVTAAMGALLGARGGVQIPDGDRKGVYNAITKYYKKFDKEVPEFKSLEKGAVADELAEDDMQEAKWANMRSAYEVFYAFCDAYYDENMPVEAFSELLKETIGLLSQVADGTYTVPENSSEDMSVGMALARGVNEEKLQGFMELTIKDIGDNKKKYTDAIIKEMNDDGSFTAIGSTGAVDRHGEIVSPDGWDLSNFKKNPVLLWSHDHTIPAIGKATKVWVDGKGAQAKLVFQGIWQTVTDEGKAAAQLVKEGILNSFSVGFLPSEMDGDTYTKQELLEISLVNVPANPQAMMLAYKSLKKSGFGEEVIKNLGIKAMDKKAMKQTLADMNDSMSTMADTHKALKSVHKALYGHMCSMMESMGMEPPVKSFDQQTDKEVVDNFKLMEKDIKELNDKVESLVKAQDPSAAPQAPSKVIRERQSLAKVVVRAADQILEGEKTDKPKNERVELTKVIKRAAEILSKSHKEEIRNG